MITDYANIGSTLKKFVLASLTVTALIPSAFAQIQLGQVPPKVIIDGDNGGRVDGEAWSSDSIKGHVTSLFYIDPEEKSKNEPIEEAYKKEKFPFETHKSIAIVNMAAAWYPNSMIESNLKSKQKEFPNTTYVRDRKKVLVKEWGLVDDSINLVVFDKDGKVIFLQKGPTPSTDFPKLMDTIRTSLK
jgi:uncharacterized protein